MLPQATLLIVTYLITVQCIPIPPRLSHRHVVLSTLHVMHVQRVGPWLRANIPTPLIRLLHDHNHECRFMHAWSLSVLLDRPSMILPVTRIILLTVPLPFSERPLPSNWPLRASPRWTIRVRFVLQMILQAVGHQGRLPPRWYGVLRTAGDVPTIAGAPLGRGFFRTNEDPCGITRVIIAA